MAAEPKQKLRLEIAHVLFIDIVAYSRMAIDEQRRAIEQLNEIVRGTEEFRKAEAAQRLLKIPTGDGMALVFYDSPEAPVECAMEISRSTSAPGSLRLRMGINSGPISGVVDVNGRANVAGEGINVAQRVMNCGDAGHILLSQRVAQDLSQFKHWRPHLHDLGECEVKHGVRIGLVNLFTSELGNSDKPAAIERMPAVTPTQTHEIASPEKSKRWPWLLAAAAAALVIITGAILFWRIHSGGISSRAAENAKDKSIAVLPFENLSADKENAFFADGVQDEILTNLAKIADLKVISRTSVMQYKSGLARNLKEIGKQLGVAHLLEGSVQRAANRIRVNAQLIDARTDAHLWAQTYDRDLADVFAIQSELAKAIADQLRAKILPHEQKGIEAQLTKDLGAYDLYVRATEELDGAPNSDQSKPHFLAAVNLLEEAVRRDPTFVVAYCKLAKAHDQLYLFGHDHTPARLAMAEQALNTAQSLQPDAPEVHLALAGHFYSKLDYDRARDEMAIVRRTLPNEPKAFEWAGYIDRRQGRWNESTRELERALELDPNNVFVLEQISTSYQCLHEYSKQASTLDRIVALKSGSLDARISRAQMEVPWKADPRPLHEVVTSAVASNPGVAQEITGTRLFLAFAERDVPGGLQALADLGDRSWGPNALQFPRAAGEGIFNRLKGDMAAAEASFLAARDVQSKIVEKQTNYGPGLAVMAQIDAGLGRKEDALQEMRRAVELTPTTKDAINGAHIVALSAIVYSLCGEKDLAIEQLKHAVNVPGAVSYGQLKLFPQWDALRGDPRFEEIVASLAPKEGQ